MALEFINNVPLSSEFSDLYCSRHGGWDEKTYVFVQGNALPERFPQAENFIIAELGFGIGLSFLTTLDAWQRYSSTQGSLHFYSIEAYPLTQEELYSALRAQEVPAPLQHALLESWPQCPFTHDLTLTWGSATLHLLVGDVRVKLSALPHTINAWFLDGFSPVKNPTMWGDDLWKTMATHSTEQATASTYSCANLVRQGLTSAGFSWQKVKGFAYKDGMLLAHKKEA